MLQHLLAIAVADTLINLTVDGQLSLCNQLLIITIFCFDVVLDGVAIEAIRQRDVDSEVFKKDEAGVAAFDRFMNTIGAIEQ